MCILKSACAFFLILIPMFSWATSPQTEAYQYVEKLITSIPKEAKILTADQHPVQKNKKMTLYFIWASWCEYCDRAFIDLKQFEQKYTSDGLVIEGLCADNNLPAIQAKLKTHNPLFRNRIIDSALIRGNNGINRLPVIILANERDQVEMIYSGYTNERANYIKKSISSFLKQGANEEN